MSATTTKRWQAGLIASGVALLLTGNLVLLNDVDPSEYIGILVWFAGALIVHDGIAALAVFGISVLMRRFGRRIPLGVIAIVQGALVVAAIVTAVVVPEILKQQLGSANPTILPLDYAGNLVLFYTGLGMLTAIAIALYLAVFARRQKLRPSISHD